MDAMMTVLRRTIPILAGVLLTGTPAGAADREPDGCTSAVVDTAAWGRIDTGVFTLRLPGGYRTVRTQGIDSAVDEWRASHGRRVHSDYGPTMYVGDSTYWETNPLCERGPDGSWKIVTYEESGRYGIGYWGRDPSREERALVLTAESPRREDLPELLAIIHSLRWTTETR